MNRILIEDERNYVVARLVPDIAFIDDFPEDVLAGIPELIYELKWFLYYTYRDPGESKGLFEARFMGIPMVKTLFNQRTATLPHSPVISLRNFFTDTVDQILHNMVQSGAPEEQLQPSEIEISFLFRPVTGAGSLKPVEGMTKITAKSHILDGKKINCAAFAIAAHLYTGKNPSRDLKRIMIDALDIQEKCGFDEFVEMSQLKRAVDLNPSYRITVILPGIDDASRYTYTGKNYVLEFEDEEMKKLTEACEKRTIYLVFDMEKRHYGVPRGLIIYQPYSKFFCHSCLKYRTTGSRKNNMCPCHNYNLPTKKLRTHRNCQYCGKADCGNGRGTCFRKCQNCVAKIRNEYTHDNHRCIVHDESKIETFQEIGECNTKERKSKLWAYDLESAREIVNLPKMVYKRGSKV